MGEQNMDSTPPADAADRDDILDVIAVERVSKFYHLYAQPSDRLKQMLFGWRKSYYKNFPALSDVSLKVQKGETVGIVGRNGSGKSTLLQVICGTVEASGGAVEVNGRVAALLELGAGFNPEFTGKENVFLNGSIIGLSRAEISERYQSIIDFADIGHFINQPVKTYSSGMYVRLAFATAINADPDVLIVDEALSVGDEAFRRKCFARIEQIKNNGATILFVSHSAQSIVQLCSRAILLDRGEKILEGDPKLVINQYQRLINLNGEEAETTRQAIIDSKDQLLHDHKTVAVQDTSSVPATQESYDRNLTSKSMIVYESKGAVISNPQIVNENGQLVNTLQVGRKYTYTFRVDFHEDVSKAAFGMLINTTKGIGVVGASTRGDARLHLTSIKAGSCAEVKFQFTCNLVPSSYFINAGVSNPESGDGEFLHRILDGVMFRVAPVEAKTSTGIVDTGIVPSARIVHE